MDIARTVVDLRRSVAALRAEGRRIALVPTMGALHEGHLSLVELAGRDGHAVVVTLFVNPAQFGAGEDLTRYPRDEERDAALAAERGAVLLFAPDADDVYPPGFGTTVTVDGPSQGLEGAARPEHFAGVATVVAKLLLAARPDRAVFGQKDAQQVAVVRRLMRDLHLDDVELVVGPTVREADGLAMSSRNAYLDPETAPPPPALYRGLSAAAGAGLGRRARRGGRRGRRPRRHRGASRAARWSTRPWSTRHVPPPDRPRGPALLAVAARLGPTRLIDNIPLPTPSRRADVPPLNRTMLKSKIHRATVTDANLNYVGSITVDRDLLEAADIRPYEQVVVLNINTGARFKTYAIEGPPGGATSA